MREWSLVVRNPHYLPASPLTMTGQLALVFSCLLSVSLAQQTALLTGGFNGYEGSRDGCELLSQAGFSTPGRGHWRTGVGDASYLMP